jgi:hypothetical protein
MFLNIRRVRVQPILYKGVKNFPLLKKRNNAIFQQKYSFEYKRECGIISLKYLFLKNLFWLNYKYI